MQTDLLLFLSLFLKQLPRCHFPPTPVAITASDQIT